MATGTTTGALFEVAGRIRALRGEAGYSIPRMAELTGLDEETYRMYEAGETDLPFTFIHKCAQIFKVEIVELMEGSSARLSRYAVTRRGKGELTAHEPGIEIRSLASRFKDKIADPYWVRYAYSEEEQNKPIHLVTHGGQEFDLVLEGSLKVQVGDNAEVLFPGDSIYYDSSTPHGMIALDGQDCVFCAVILAEEENVQWEHGHIVNTRPVREAALPAAPAAPNYMADFVEVRTDENGVPKQVQFKDPEHFNFAFDVVDAIAAKEPDRLAMLHLDREGRERRFTFGDMKKMSARAANYFRALGIKKGDRVMLVLRRRWEFWPIIVGLHKLGAIPIPATDQMVQKDYEYRFQAAAVSAVVCAAYGQSAPEVEKAAVSCPTVQVKVLCGGPREGWRDFDAEYDMYSSRFPRTEETPCGKDPMLMLFTSGTSGYPKAAVHAYTYPLGHYITARCWHRVEPDGLHLTISDTGWGKALWGKLYGQWMCGAATFVYDFDRFHAEEILPLFAKYGITTFCAPPTIYRFLIREDLSRYDLSSLRNANTAGEAMNPEVFNRFKEATGLSIMEAFGQTETTLTVGTFAGMTPKPGSMGKPNPAYKVEVLNSDGTPTPMGEPGEICIDTRDNVPCGLFLGYYGDEEGTAHAWHDGYYHTGDLAWQDEDGYFWYVGRADDLIKSSGYRIGPFEIESVIMELPYVLECGVSPEPDEVRGQIVKASVVLTKGTQPTEELKKEIQEYVKSRTAPYKYPRLVVFRDELPKSHSGKIQHKLL